MVTINGTAGADTIEPGNNSAGNNNLNGNDTINGLDGEDFISGGRGSDSLFGGLGNDILNGVDGGQADILDGGVGDDIVDYSNAASRQRIFFDPAGNSRGERASDTWISIEGVMGATNHRNTIIGAGTDDRIIGGNMNDRLFGRDGMDALEGRQGNDRLDGGAGFDILNGGRGSDRLTGGADTDIFYFEAGEIDGNDRIQDFELGTDLVFLEKTGVTLAQVSQIIASNAISDPNGDIVYTDPTEGGTITFSGVSYNALTAFLGTGGDLSSVFYVGTPSPAPQSGPPGIPALPEITRGTRRADTLEGGDDSDFQYGRGGRDTLDGGAGSDFLNGGRGRDTMTGGDGADWFVFGRRDTIIDFNIAEGDTILFRASRGLTFDDLNIRQVGSDTLVSIGRARMRLEDFTDTLTEDSFNFAYVPGETEFDLL
ncbi:calcium-binding protein [Anderseniella sp. Alg231-50]|uniref:calcium-binding protein n=1 Tax=Anderseniella sp. Alg231-50 TaxID=1922226 RepID=UPI000D55809C